MAGCDQLWLRLQWLGFDDWLRAANGFGFNGLVSKPGYELENASASMAGCGFNGLFESGYEMPGYDLKSDFGFNV
jgi:hypothetical protein